MSLSAVPFVTKPESLTGPAFDEPPPINYSPEYMGENDMSIDDCDDSEEGEDVGETPYVCNVCGKGFSIPARLQRHERIHTGEKPYCCEFCDKTFSVKENLNVHRRIHTKERPYKCDVCGRAFEHSGKLHRHMRTHTGERPHKCEVCGKTFVQSGQLVIHMRAHTGEKPYSCDYCPKGFTCSKQLKVHIRTHTGEKPYKCDECGKTFGYNHVLKMHKMSHLGEKLYKCTLCDNFFNSRKALDSHIREHEENSGNAKPKRKSSKNSKKNKNAQTQQQKKTNNKKMDISNNGKLMDLSNRDSFGAHSPGYISDDSGRGLSPLHNAPSPNSSRLFDDQMESNIYKNNLPHVYGSAEHSPSIFKGGNFGINKILYGDTSSKIPKLPANDLMFLKTSSGEMVVCPAQYVIPLKDFEKSDNLPQWDTQNIIAQQLKLEETKKNNEINFIVSVKKVLQALLSPQILNRFGYPENSVDDILINTLQIMNIQACLEPSLAPMDRIKVNLRLLLEGCVTDQDLWMKFGWRGKSIEEIIKEFLQHC